MSQPLSDDELILHNVMSNISKIEATKAFDEHKVNILYELVMGLKTLSERNSPIIANVVNESFYIKLRGLLLDKDKNIRETIIRILRYVSVNPQAFQLMCQNNIPLLITRCLERDAKQNLLMERFQSLKLISHWVETNPATIPKIFFQSLVAIATLTPEDQIKKPVIEILRKSSLFCTNYCALSGALKILIESIIDPSCSEISESIVLTLLYLINDPKTRSYLRPFIDLGYLMSVFTEIPGHSMGLKTEMQNKLEMQLFLGRRAIVTLMKNWSGLIYLTSYSNGLRSLVQALDQPIRLIVKKAIFDIFFDVFNINMSYDEDRTKGSLKQMNSDNLLNTYMIMVIQAFNLCGIYNVLIKLATSVDSELTDKAQQLLKKFMQLSSILLPVEPKVLSLIELSSDFKAGDPSLRFRASKTLSELGDCYKETAVITPEMKKNMSPYFLRSVEFTISTPQGVPYKNQLKRILRPLRAELDYNLDASQFSALLKSTNVVNFKNEFIKWDWKVLLELFENNLQKSVRMKEALDSKLVKYLIKFFQPGKGKFVDKPWSPENFLYAKVGYNMIKCMLQSKKGRTALVTRQSESAFTSKSFLNYYVEQLNLEIGYIKAVKEGSKMPEGERYFSKNKLLQCIGLAFVFI